MLYLAKLRNKVCSKDINPKFFKFNVSNKPIETSANEILNMMANRFEYRGRRLDSPYMDAEEELYCFRNYSTVTDFARLRGWSTSQPRITAI